MYCCLRLGSGTRHGTGGQLMMELYGEINGGEQHVELE